MTQPILSTDELVVLKAYGNGSDQKSIAKLTRLNIDVVNEIVMQRTNLSRPRAAELVRQHMFNTPVAAPVVQAPAPVVVQSANAEATIAAGEGHANTRIRTLAGRVRTELTTLRQLLDEDTQARKQREEVAQAQARAKARLAELEAELVKVRAVLRPAGAKKTAAKKTGAGRNIRSWALHAGLDCPAFGRIPGRVLEAYHAAHPNAAKETS